MSPHVCLAFYLVRGILKGYDLMVNLVLDETVETLPGTTSLIV